MSNLKSIFAPTAQKSSTKTPAFYSAQKTSCLRELAMSADEVVRAAIATSSSAPSGILKEMLAVETEHEVLRTILMNENLSKKAIAAFISTSDKAAAFDEDEELVEYFRTRFPQ